MKKNAKTKQQLLLEMEALRGRLDVAEQRLKEANEMMRAELAERKRAEKTLVQAQKYAESIVETIREPLLVLAPDLKIISANQSFYQTFKVTPEETEGRFIYSVGNHQWDIPALRKLLEEIVPQNTHFTDFEVDHEFPVIGRRAMLLNARRIYEKGKKTEKILVAIEDITEHKSMEEAVQVSETRYRRLFETAQDGILILDADTGQILDVNPFLTEMLGYSHETLLGKKLWEIGAFKDIEASKAGFSELQTKGYVRYEDLPLETGDGRPIDVEFVSNVYRINHKKVIQCNIRDISQRKQANEDRKKLEAYIQRLEKMEALGMLAGGVAHDLNNILSSIVGYPDLILMQLPDDSPLRESILAIQRSGQKAAAVVQDLLTLARRGMVSAEVMNLNSVISDSMKSPEQEKNQLLHPNVRFEVLLESDLLPVKGSRVHLSKTVMNLLSNAAESISEKGVVTISTRNHYLDRPIKGYEHVKEGDYAVLEVTDTGGGISTRDMDKIFEPFYTKKMMGRSGSGLGLAVVWGTVKDHNGYIDVQSEEGKGTTFTLYFAVTRETLTLDPSPISLSDYMGRAETILVVDDVREQRELVVDMLRRMNYQVTAVSSGEAAVEYCKRRQVDLLILDMIMDPGIDGLETYKRILQLHPAQKAIIVSGFSETERVRQAQCLGAGAYIRKPYILKKIALEVRRELDKCSLSTRNHLS